jgi:hypothetical protein
MQTLYNGKRPTLPLMYSRSWRRWRVGSMLTRQGGRRQKALRGSLTYVVESADKGGSIPVQVEGKKTIRQRSNLDDLTDISWLDRGPFKEHMRQVFTNKYGQAFDG